MRTFVVVVVHCLIVLSIWFEMLERERVITKLVVVV